ncbi:unnamed protein product [Lupinus luteus]|uniref:Uncharacterized protein n=1 Tax=Lupinus luteus TaxID=3873 RepID=A0AAV1XHH0_LUPLU
MATCFFSTSNHFLAPSSSPSLSAKSKKSSWQRKTCRRLEVVFREDDFVVGCVGLFRRLNQAIPARPACAEVVLGKDNFSPLGSRLCRRQLYLRTNRCPPRVSGEKSQEGSRLRGRHLRHS